MIFRPELAARILAGEKTVTRRIANGNPRSPWYRGRCALRPGRSYAVSPGRGRAQLCRIVIDSVDLQPGPGHPVEHRLQPFGRQ